MSYRTNINVKVPTGRYLNQRSNRLYRALRTIPNRANSIIMYNRVWPASIVQNDTFLATLDVVGNRVKVFIPLVRSYIPESVQVEQCFTGRGANRQPISLWMNDPPLSGGDLLSINGENIEAFIGWLRTQLLATRNAPFFRSSPEYTNRFQITLKRLPYSSCPNTREAAALLRDARNTRENAFTNASYGFGATLTEALDKLEIKLKQHMDKYENNSTTAYELIVERLQLPAGFGQGTSFRSVKQVSKVWIQPHIFSKINCAYVSVAMAHKAQEKPEFLLEDEVQQRRAGYNLKQRMKAKGMPGVYPNHADYTTIKSMSEYLKQSILVYDNLFHLVFEHHPRRKHKTVKKGDIEVMLHDLHYSPLIRRAMVPTQVSEVLEELDATLESFDLSQELTPKMRKVFQTLSEGTPLPIVNKYIVEKKPSKFSQFSSSEFDRRSIAAWDLETAEVSYSDRDQHSIFKSYMCGVAWYEEEREMCKQWEGDLCCQEFLLFLYQNAPKFNNVTFYAHSGGRFDLPILLREAVFCKWRLHGTMCPFTIDAPRCLELNGSWISFVLKSRDNKIRITFRDSYRLLPSSLDSLGREFKCKNQKLGGVDHSAVTIDNWKLEPLHTQLLEYHKADCLTLLEVVERFGTDVQSNYNVNVTQCLTVASLAKATFWKNYQSLEVYTLPFDMDLFVRRSYFGGRCECFWLGRIHDRFPKTYYYDFTSLYPAMCTLDLPIGEPTWCDHDDVFLENGVIRDDFHGFVYVRVCKLEEDNRGFKPLHAIVLNGRLTFPWPDAAGVKMYLYSEEIRYAQKLGMPYYYHSQGSDGKAIRFNKGPLLKPMIEACYEHKRIATIEGNKAKRMVTKILLNSSYGFWALRTKGRDSVIVVNESKDCGATYMRYIGANKLIGSGLHRIGDERFGFHRVERDLNSLEINVAVASAVTSLARCRLHKAITAFERIPGGKVFYCDTDSLITNVQLSSHQCLIDEFQWDLEKDCRDTEGQLLGNLKSEGDDLIPKGQLEQQRLVDGGDCGFDECYILGCKFYAVVKRMPDGTELEITKCKGFSNRQGDHRLNSSDFDRMCDTKDEVEEMYDQYIDGDLSHENLREMLKTRVLTQNQRQFRIGKHSYMQEGDMGFAIELVDTQKLFRINYTKGKELDTGEIVPLVVDEKDVYEGQAIVKEMDQSVLDQAMYEEMLEEENPQQIELGDVFDDECNLCGVIGCMSCE